METPSTHDIPMRESRQGAAATAERRRRDHRFYLAMSLAVAITVVAGFAKTFYFKSYFHNPALHPATEIHGLLNTCWILLFVVQNALIAADRRALHRKSSVVTPNPANGGHLKTGQ